MDALTAFFALNAVLCALALLGFHGVRFSAMEGEERDQAQVNAAGMAGLAISVAFVSAIGALFV
jgi:hypothetical protein